MSSNSGKLFFLGGWGGLEEEEVGRQHQEMDGPGVLPVPPGSGEQEKMEKTGCDIICGAPTTLAVKRLIMMRRRRIFISKF